MRLIKVLVLPVVIAAIVSFSGCVTVEGLLHMDTPSSSERAPKPSATAAKKSVPDYNTPESAFVTGDFNVLGSEFLNEEAGKYVVLDGVYQASFGGTLIYKNNRPISLIGMRSLRMAKDTTYQKRLDVIWPESHKEDGRPLVKLQVGDKIRIYAYVLAGDQEPTERNGTRLTNLKVPTIWLIRIAPPEKKQ